jgi:hypothetical protein
VQDQVKRLDVEAAAADLRTRTLGKLSGDMARLLYLASMRDYNSGEYFHDGLAIQFSQEVACDALKACHTEVFKRLAFLRLESLVDELEAYLTSSGLRPEDFFSAWRRIEPFRVAVPLDCDPLSSRLFCSNVRIALAVLASRLEDAPDQQCASPPRLPDR